VKCAGQTHLNIGQKKWWFHQTFHPVLTPENLRSSAPLSRERGNPELCEGWGEFWQQKKQENNPSKILNAFALLKCVVFN
jgi:hypothetical protein